uniref:Ribonuclease H-like domain-containing protein n=1 Tax=Tanacetum cinerariifolium TaxID=118510 RepID=A0A699KD34_TANCI|nr:ribonuclease H-like domain-containing protein [Tanacetum cinerariifolium]
MKNEMKARGTLLMSIPNKDQVKFHSYKDAKLLMEALKKRYGGNKQSKKVQRRLLKQQYENFIASSSKTLDQTFDRLQKLISQLKIQRSSSTRQNPQNVAFVSSNSTNSTSSTNEADNTAFGVSTAHSQKCFNCHKNGHFVRECRASKNQENRGRDYGRKTVPVENPTKNTLIAQDGIGRYDWSYQAEEEHPINYALMALTSS